MKDGFDSTDENDFKCSQKYKNAKQGSAGHIFWEQTCLPWNNLSKPTPRKAADVHDLTRGQGAV